jgi:hypothetical protein
VTPRKRCNLNIFCSSSPPTPTAIRFHRSSRNLPSTLPAGALDFVSSFSMVFSPRQFQPLTIGRVRFQSSQTLPRFNPFTLHPGILPLPGLLQSQATPTVWCNATSWIVGNLENLPFAGAPFVTGGFTLVFRAPPHCRRTFVYVCSYFLTSNSFFHSKRWSIQHLACPLLTHPPSPFPPPRNTPNIRRHVAS